MKYNPWKTLRLAGATVVIVSYFVHNIVITVLGLTLIAIGTINGLLSLERRVEDLEAKNEKSTS